MHNLESPILSASLVKAEYLDARGVGVVLRFIGRTTLEMFLTFILDFLKSGTYKEVPYHR